MIDNRFPQFVALSASDAPSWQLRAAREIAARAGVGVAWDRRARRFWFYLREVDVGVFSADSDPGPGYRLEAGDEDEIVSLINRGRRASRSRKDWILRCNRENDRMDNRIASDAMFADTERDARSYADFLHRRRRGVPRTILPVGA